MFICHLKDGTIINSCKDVTGGCTAGPLVLGIYVNAPISKIRH